MASVFVSMHHRTMPPAMQASFNGFFDLDIVEPPATKESFQMQEHMKISWHQVWAVGVMIELFPAKCRDEILFCGGSAWASIVMKHHNIVSEERSKALAWHFIFVRP
jgi:hypothetical protein